ncbi:branched-chain amino acid ABC transporter [Pseudoalteromonas rubra]|uniref:Branched-chain amino acid ABC transporter n=1 Tax=Pseudoalteromonas rubra TaxID=43658 RepID=A0A5S3WHQ3_9GAMM|nr:AzlD domain-containing protein [Pseudoalteromonas rubra]TMP26702.1 branched-chain amino acid ABC transporter [Pseudoalteromonas rubra]TMP30678.1 branched-chain amino acid ABC transporter [Pseudoalteromonas rubra]
MSYDLILLMALITFFMRYAFFMEKLPIKLDLRVQRFLSFTAPCILTAMAAPIVFGEMVFTAEDITNPFLLAGIIAIVLSLLVKNTLFVVLASMGVFFSLKTML